MLLKLIVVDIDYVEVYGIGILLGDLIEFDLLSKVFSD